MIASFVLACNPSRRRWVFILPISNVLFRLNFGQKRGYCQTCIACQITLHFVLAGRTANGVHINRTRLKKDCQGDREPSCVSFLFVDGLLLVIPTLKKEEELTKTKPSFCWLTRDEGLYRYIQAVEMASSTCIMLPHYSPFRANGKREDSQPHKPQQNGNKYGD